MRMQANHGLTKTGPAGMEFDDLFDATPLVDRKAKALNRRRTGRAC